MNPPHRPASPAFLAGYPYCPQMLRNRARPGSAMACRFYVLLKEGGLATVKEMIAAQPQLLADLLPIVANPEASMNVRVGASVVFEHHAGSAALQALVPKLGVLSTHADARVRADACHYLGIAGATAARLYLALRLNDRSAEVREIAADSLEALGSARG
ncbi:MAG: hypothetical protein PHY45_08660 [Rhodocyclaceae bacterium]|nr:hypothetical protein [Rhodocyclaceae bacterium]